MLNISKINEMFKATGHEDFKLIKSSDYSQLQELVYFH